MKEFLMSLLLALAPADSAINTAASADDTGDTEFAGGKGKHVKINFQLAAGSKGKHVKVNHQLVAGSKGKHVKVGQFFELDKGKHIKI